MSATRRITMPAATGVATPSAAGLMSATDANAVATAGLFFDPLPGSFGVVPVNLNDTAALMVGNMLYARYIGQALRAVTLNYIKLYVKTNGSGAQEAEFAVLTTPAAPTGADVTLTKLWATGSLTVSAADAILTNATPAALTIPVGTHTWLAARANYGGNQPTIFYLNVDHRTGRLVRSAAAGALTASGPWTGTSISGWSGACPALWASS